jgi:aspartyl-tRNA(Asn)/glutamyl-tRNA(Gln) amidotransferase subunit A
MTELYELDAVELLARFATGEATPLDAVDSCLARIDAVEPEVNAVVTLLADEARAQAAESTRRWRAGTARALEGVPYGLKDIIATKGVRTTGGSLLYQDHVPAQSAALADRLDAAGGILLAKLVTFEFAFGHQISRPDGPMRNPWDPARTAGGSSSGSGAALAAREMPLTIGTDTGGSIRLPASYCGITGMKATYGRVPRHGVMPLSWTLDHAGPMARSAADVALMLGVVAGFDDRDPASLAAPVTDWSATVGAGVEGLRIGVCPWFSEVAHPDVLAAMRSCLAVLTEAGADVIEVDLPHIGLSETICWAIMMAEVASLHAITLDRLDEYDDAFAERLTNAHFITARDYLHGLRARTLVQQDFEAAFTGLRGPNAGAGLRGPNAGPGVDVILTPGSPSTAPRFDEMTVDVGGPEPVSWLDAAPRCTMVFNVTGMPALSFPTGFSAGLPVGAQVAAAPGREDLCLRVVGAYQALTDVHRRQPALAGAAVG